MIIGEECKNCVNLGIGSIPYPYFLCNKGFFAYCYLLIFDVLMIYESTCYSK